MSRSELIPASVVRLLEQTSAAADVPDPTAFVTHHWLRPVCSAMDALVTAAQDEDHSVLSFRGNGQDVLLLAKESQYGCFVYLRRSFEGATSPIEATEKSVTLTLSGSAQMEAFRDQGDVENDEPWYVRDFDSESIYACHPGTIHRLDLSDDCMQLVLSREELKVIEGARTITPEEYQVALQDARPQLMAAVNEQLSSTRE